uniref:LOW QUALITY PROTEIN: uncharacterized protein LOC120333223 n=1 Tax=Styela clava TaxID=7725 RepID=UPI00193A2191|nr:LOW QUALITY PROTEIN: uncharacterized protein LOC120333223 [Styela clava]
MAKDMSFGSTTNNNKNSMSQETSFDISDLYQNEDSIDLTNYMTSANLELCDDDLFQSLFPSGNDTVVKSEKPDPYESELGDWWTEPGSAYSSACSSAAPSPVQFFNTPPVTPLSDKLQQESSPETIRQQQLFNKIDSLNSQCRGQLTPITLCEDPGNTIANETLVTIKNEPDSTQLNRVYFIKTEKDQNNNDCQKSLAPDLIRVPSRDQLTGINYGETEEIYNTNGKRALTTDISKSPKPSKRAKNLPKDSEEYKVKRERNNVAVRKSRDKAKIKSMETQRKVADLSNENKRLHDRVNELTHELNTLKGILKSLPQSTQIAN